MWLFLLATIGLSNAEEPAEIIKDADYVEVQQGQPTPFEGFLFTTNAVSTIIAKHDEELSLLSANHDLEMKKLESKYKLDYDTLDLRYKSETEMYKQMIEVRDVQLRSASRKDILQKWGTYGAFVVGAATSVAIFYSVNHN
tara:strand:+ start:2941 stop:3363 length:423 start_codon:yes stop_codon:yes gene_type:complete